MKSMQFLVSEIIKLTMTKKALWIQTQRNIFISLQELLLMPSTFLPVNIAFYLSLPRNSNEPFSIHTPGCMRYVV